MRLGAPRLNAEWIELLNCGTRSVNIRGYFVVNDRGDGFEIALPGAEKTLVGPYESVTIFSGFPDNPGDPAACFLSNQAFRLFIKRRGYFWSAEEDIGYLHASRRDYSENPRAYLDLFHYRRHSAALVIGPRD